jgi:hypothetical protein
MHNLYYYSGTLIGLMHCVINNTVLKISFPHSSGRRGQGALTLFSTFDNANLQQQYGYSTYAALRQILIHHC